MTSAEKLEYIIKLIADKRVKPVSIGKAKNIDIEKRTCDIEIAPDLTLYQCRLNAVIDTYDNHIVVVPKEDSFVAFTVIDNQTTNALVIACSDIERVIVTVGSSKVEIKDKEIILNGGKNEGLIKIEELQKRLKNLESKYNNHTHPYMNVQVSATTSPPPTPSTEFQTQTTHPYNYENDKVKH